jgi:hypothetical protein
MFISLVPTKPIDRDQSVLDINRTGKRAIKRLTRSRPMSNRTTSVAALADGAMSEEPGGRERQRSICYAPVVERYRFILFNSDGTVADARNFPATNDDVAMKLADGWRGSERAELWCADRQVRKWRLADTRKPFG